jgi:hypothetical protein
MAYRFLHDGKHTVSLFGRNASDNNTIFAFVWLAFWPGRRFSQRPGPRRHVEDGMPGIGVGDC